MAQPKEQDKGYVPELVTMRTQFKDDRDPQPIERLTRAFPKTETKPTSSLDTIWHSSHGSADGCAERAGG